MILADTHESVVSSASHYYYVGPDAQQDISRTIDAADGLAEQDLIRDPERAALVAELNSGASGIQDVVAIQGLHKTLRNFSQGIEGFCRVRQIAYDPMQNDEPVVIGTDGLFRIIDDEQNLRVLTDDAAATLGSDLPIAKDMGATHIAYQYDADFGRTGRISDGRPLQEYMSLGIITGEGAYAPIATLLRDTVANPSLTDEPEVGRMRARVAIAPHIVAAPSSYMPHI